MQTLYTYHDLYRHLVDRDTGSADGARQRLAKTAILNAYRDLVKSYDWVYYRRDARITTSPAYSTGTVEYTASTRTLTLSDGTWPDWAARGFVRIGARNYPVQVRTSDTVLVLRENEAPTSNIASGTTYKIYRSVYPLPVNFGSAGTFTDTQRDYRLQYMAPNQFSSYKQNDDIDQEPWCYTIIGDPEYFNGWAIELYPVPGGVTYVYDYTYSSNPAALRHLDYRTGTVTVTAGSATVTGTGTAWTSDMVGSVIRFTAGSELPDGITGENPYAEERVIQSVTNATTLVLDAAVSNAYAAKKYRISSLIDVDERTMMTALYKGVEYQFASAVRDAQLPLILGEYQKAYIEAKAADNRTMSGSDTDHRPYYTSLADIGTE